MRIADQVVPLLRETLTMAERAVFNAMLTQVANAHSAPSGLQRAGIAHLRRKLLTDPMQVGDAQ